MYKEQNQKEKQTYSRVDEVMLTAIELLFTRTGYKSILNALKG